jgi:sugar-specific transcriptional regulator TrmB
MIDQQNVEALINLGLSEREAKVYLTLFSSGPSSIKVISKNSGVARQDIYRVIDSLYKKGMVAQIISSPTAFLATPLQKSLEILFQKKTDAINKTLSSRDELLKSLGGTQPQRKFEEPQFVLVSGKGQILFNKKKVHERVIHEICFAGPWEAFMTYFVFVTENLEKTKINDVTIRIIIDKPDDSHVQSRINCFLKKYEHVEVKFAEKAPHVISIHDGKICSFTIYSNKFDVNDINILRSTNPSFIDLIQTYFDNLWKTLP